MVKNIKKRLRKNKKLTSSTLPSKKGNFAKKIDEKKKLPSRNLKNIKTEKSKRKFYFISISLAILFLTLLVFVFFKFLVFLFLPLPKTFGHFDACQKWDKKSQLNLLLVELEDSSKKSSLIENIYLIALEIENKQVRVLKITEDVYLDTAKGKGLYELDKVYALGAVGDEKENILFLKDTLEKNLSINIDRYLIVDSKYKLLNLDFDTVKPWQDWLSSSEREKISRFGGGLEIINTLKAAPHNFATNLTPYEFFLFSKSLSQIEESKFSIFSLPENSLLSEIDDGDEIKSFDFINLDNFMQTNFYHSQFRQESLKFKIFNATETPQIASSFSRLITNLGGEVIEIANHDQDLEKTLILVSKKYENSATINLLECLCKGEKQTSEVSDIERADILIYVGKDWVSKMEGEETL